MNIWHIRCINIMCTHNIRLYTFCTHYGINLNKYI
nr:MAG TPA: hypothetical protein [Caudoviricetes sp.]